MKKLLRILFWTLVTGGLLFTVGFALKQEDLSECREVNIFIHRTGENYFVEEEHIRALVEHDGPLKGRPMGSIQVHELERLVNSNPWVAEAQVFMGIDGRMRIDVWQKEPLLRIVNSRGESFYLDDQGGLMVWSDEFSPRVLVASGNIPETFSRWYSSPLVSSSTPDSVKKLTILDELFFLSKYIRSDTLWNAQVEQVHVNGDKEFELIPRIGDHRILFGDTSDMKEKFTKLELFYREGLNHTGWNQYDTLNLKFKNQVVCSKIQ